VGDCLRGWGVEVKKSGLGSKFTLTFYNQCCRKIALADALPVVYRLRDRNFAQISGFPEVQSRVVGCVRPCLSIPDKLPNVGKSLDGIVGPTWQSRTSTEAHETLKPLCLVDIIAPICPALAKHLTAGHFLPSKRPIMHEVFKCTRVCTPMIFYPLSCTGDNLDTACFTGAN